MQNTHRALCLQHCATGKWDCDFLWHWDEMRLSNQVKVRWQGNFPLLSGVEVVFSVSVLCLCFSLCFALMFVFFNATNCLWSGKGKAFLLNPLHALKRNSRYLVQNIEPQDIGIIISDVQLGFLPPSLSPPSHGTPWQQHSLRVVRDCRA